MATAKDFKSDTDGDLFIDGDFVIAESDNQHIVDLVTANKGSYKEYPLCGVGIDSYLNSNATQLFLTKEIKTQLTTDGYGNIDIQYASNNSLDFTIDAVRS